MAVSKMLANWRAAELKRLLSGSRAWTLLDELGIPGFGRNLLRVFYPLDRSPRASWGPDGEAHALLEKFFQESESHFEKHIPSISAAASAVACFPLTERQADESANPFSPFIENYYLPLADMLLLYGMLSHFKPLRFVEVGSGISTRIAHTHRIDDKSDMQIISIDPEPRVEVDQVCDQVFRRRFESPDTMKSLELREGDIFSFDGSHYCFPGNDVVHFFMNVLPILPAGIIVHIHDVFLPFDYPHEHRAHHWGEQYLLAAWILGGASNMKVLFPGAYMAKQPLFESVIQEAKNLTFQRHGKHCSVTHTCSSFWFQTCS